MLGQWDPRNAVLADDGALAAWGLTCDQVFCFFFEGQTRREEKK